MWRGEKNITSTKWTLKNIEELPPQRKFQQHDACNKNNPKKKVKMFQFSIAVYNKVSQNLVA